MTTKNPYPAPRSTSPTRDAQLHASITTEARAMLNAIGKLRGQTASYAVEQLIRDTCYGKQLTAKERKDLWTLIDKEMADS